jgi:hypothetical protein
LGFRENRGFVLAVVAFSMAILTRRDTNESMALLDQGFRGASIFFFDVSINSLRRDLRAKNSAFGSVPIGCNPPFH